MREVGNEKQDMRNEKSEVGNEDCECSLPISHMACTDILGEIELDPEKWEMRLRRESPSLKFSPQDGGTSQIKVNPTKVLDHQNGHPVPARLLLHEGTF